MNSSWLKRNNNTELILFFNGWGLESTAISDLNANNFDLIEFNDYSSLDFDESEFQAYAEIYVVAWSLGVWAASYILAESTLAIKKAIAINGTANPVDAKEGIHPTIFKETLSGWNEKNRTRFMMRIIGGKNEFETNRSKFGNRTVENQKTELSCLYEHIQQSSKASFNFDTALIGNQDSIFLTENQLNYWQNKAACKTIDMPHYPFLHCTSWENIIKQ